MIYNTETFDVSDVAQFQAAIESLRDALTDAGGTDIRVFRHAETANRVLVTMWWPDAQACRRFAREHEEEFGARIGPLVTAMQPEELWEAL
jgi:hypothetical protein